MSVRELPIPARVSEGREFLRLIREEKGKVIFIMDAALGEDRQGDPLVGWGIVLVDIARHLANALEGNLIDETGRTIRADEMLEHLKEVLDAEWKDPSDKIQRMTDG